MTKPDLNKDFWNERWITEETQWDIGYPAPAIVEFIDGLEDKTARILIPGCGNAYEAEYLHARGFTNVFVVDFAEDALKKFALRVPGFPKDHLLCADFFDLQGTWDIVIEQTFFCAIDPELRPKYVIKMHELLTENGVLAGLLFDHRFESAGPPFGGSQEEYKALFAWNFSFRKFEMCANSIKPREGRELWIEFCRKA